MVASTVPACNFIVNAQSNRKTQMKYLMHKKIFILWNPLSKAISYWNFVLELPLRQEYLFLAEYLKNTKSQFASNSHNIGDALGEDLRSLSESEADEEADLIGKNLIFV